MPDQNLVLETLLEVMETMAFVTPLPVQPPEPAPMPPEGLLLRIEFDLGQAGCLELAAPRALGGLLLGNIAGGECAPGGSGAEDALCELVNITCGMLLRRARRSAAEKPSMSLPTVRPLEQQDWQRLLSLPGASVLDADGHPLVIAVGGLAA
jgi:hypothetical protein